jgi:hypothetical protein
MRKECPLADRKEHQGLAARRSSSKEDASLWKPALSGSTLQTVQVI